MNNINLAVKKLNSLLAESKQSIVNLGFPEVIASILYEKYGKNAFVVSKWYKDYFTEDYEAMDNKTWWRRANTEYSLKQLGLTDLIMLYDAAKISFEEYNNTINFNFFNAITVFSFFTFRTIFIKDQYS